MASSNRHWPSMFKSKPCNTHHHQWQHDINPSSLMSSTCQRSSFNSSEYGQVGDANVFYWFQNRKSRSKHKQKHHHHHNLQSQHKTQLLSSSSLVSTSSSSSSSSSDSKTSPKGTTHDHHENKNITSSSTSESLLGSLMSSMSSSGNSFFNVSHDVSNSPLHQTSSSYPSSLDVLHHDHQVISSGPSHGLLLSEILMMNHQNGSKRILDRQDHDHQLCVALMGAPADAPRLTVFINDVAFEVSVGPFNVREAFGDDALLIHSSGQPVLTNDWGVTLQSLQPGASYYLVNT
ncbi:hypothetical protein Syun_008613 [Stephania yunnanensis]|uniref:Homeobox domain-containing protein n=1 Tax=Stephania yunnanensis TaxID=152371 RepID=A0AAP0KEX9_9MAGN